MARNRRKSIEDCRVMWVALAQVLAGMTVYAITLYSVVCAVCYGVLAIVAAIKASE